MKVMEIDKNTVFKSQNIEEKNGFTVAINPGIFMMLSQGLYRNPTLAVIRELTTNALDAHRMVNKVDTVPIEVHFPTTLEPWFSVRDFGPGMPFDFVLKTYTSFGASTKGEDVNSTGGFGIGCKSPFAVANSFTVISIHKGKKSVFFCDKNEGIPEISVISKEELTDEPDGVLVRIDGVNNLTLNDDVEELFSVFPLLPNINLKMELVKKEVDEKYKEAYIDKATDVNARQINPAHKVKVGDIIYRHYNLWELVKRETGITPRGSVLLNIPGGTVNILPSREGLVDNRVTQRGVAEAYKKFYDDLLTNYFREVKEECERIQKEDSKALNLFKVVGVYEKIKSNKHYYRNVFTDDEILDKVTEYVGHREPHFLNITLKQKVTANSSFLDFIAAAVTQVIQQSSDRVERSEVPFIYTTFSSPRSLNLKFAFDVLTLSVSGTENALFKGTNRDTIIVTPDLYVSSLVEERGLSRVYKTAHPTLYNKLKGYIKVNEGKQRFMLITESEFRRNEEVVRTSLGGELKDVIKFLGKDVVFYNDMPELIDDNEDEGDSPNKTTSVRKKKQKLSESVVVLDKDNIGRLGAFTNYTVFDTLGFSQEWLDSSHYSPDKHYLFIKNVNGNSLPLTDIGRLHTDYLVKIPGLTLIFMQSRPSKEFDKVKDLFLSRKNIFYAEDITYNLGLNSGLRKQLAPYISDIILKRNITTVRDGLTNWVICKAIQDSSIGITNHYDIERLVINFSPVLDKKYSQYLPEWIKGGYFKNYRGCAYLNKPIFDFLTTTEFVEELSIIKDIKEEVKNKKSVTELVSLILLFKDFFSEFSLNGRIKDYWFVGKILKAYYDSAIKNTSH